MWLRNVKSGELKESLAYWNSWRRVGDFDLPERILEVAAGPQGAKTTELTFRNQRLQNPNGKGFGRPPLSGRLTPQTQKACRKPLATSLYSQVEVRGRTPGLCIANDARKCTNTDKQAPHQRYVERNLCLRCLQWPVLPKVCA